MLLRKLMVKSITKYQQATRHKQHVCRHTPSCSNYALGCYKRFCFVKASFLTLVRIICCNPLVKQRYWPVRSLKRRFKNHVQIVYKPLISYENLVGPFPNISLDEYNELMDNHAFIVYAKNIPVSVYLYDVNNHAFSLKKEIGESTSDYSNNIQRMIKHIIP